LKVIVVPTGFPNLVSIQIPVQAGSRNEVEPGKSGFAHFFEHLMFRGTPNNPPRFRQIMTKAGARDDASTGDDSTRYYSTFAKQDLETIVALYADMFQHPRHRHLVRLSDRCHAHARGFRRALGRARLARRAPPVVGASLPAHSRDPQVTQGYTGHLWIRRRSGCSASFA
jgi:hypothetical protein